MVSYGTSYLLLWACWSLIKFTRNLGDTSLFVALIRAYKDNPTLPLTWTIRAALAMISYVLLMTNFMSVKTLIPEIIPFYLDEAAYKIDRILFLGRDPWTLFSWMYDFPSIIVGIDRIYTAWIGLIVGIWIYCFTSRSMPSNHRYQYIISSILLWLIAGNIMAILLSSAGPIYFDYFTGSNVYQPLKLSLAAIHETHSLGAYDYSEKLLMMYENKETRFAGISALPSMHCASSFMILLSHRIQYHYFYRLNSSRLALRHRWIDRLFHRFAMLESISLHIIIQSNCLRGYHDRHKLSPRPHKSAGG